jgi:hypothetical protein
MWSRPAGRHSQNSRRHSQGSVRFVPFWGSYREVATLVGEPITVMVNGRDSTGRRIADERLVSATSDLRRVN